MTTSTTTTEAAKKSIMERMVELDKVITDLKYREISAVLPVAYNGCFPDTLAEKMALEVGFRLHTEHCLDAVETLHGHLSRVYRTGDMTKLTYAGSLAYEPCGSRELGCDSINPNVDLVLGCQRTAYGYKLREGRKIEFLEGHATLWSWTDMTAVLDELEKRLPDLVHRVEEIESSAAESRKTFDREINDLFRTMGADKATREAWWGMDWKHEVAPEQFIEFCRKAESDPQAFALALACQSRADLERFGWMVRPSVPRTEALLHAVAKVTGIESATSNVWNAWKEQPRKWLFE